MDKDASSKTRLGGFFIGLTGVPLSNGCVFRLEMVAQYLNL